MQQSEASTSGREGQSSGGDGARAAAGQQLRRQAGIGRHTLTAGARSEGHIMQDSLEQPKLGGKSGLEAEIGQQGSVGFTSVRYHGIRLMSAQSPAAGQALAGADLAAALLEVKTSPNASDIGSSPGQPLIGEEEEFSVGGPGG